MILPIAPILSHSIFKNDYQLPYVKGRNRDGRHNEFCTPYQERGMRDAAAGW
jgi:hypothetical protein